MPGKIVIVETADKQKIELTTNAEEVSGGYYDASGTWNDFGGESELPYKEITVTNSADNDTLYIVGSWISGSGSVYTTMMLAAGEEPETHKFIADADTGEVILGVYYIDDHDFLQASSYITSDGDQIGTTVYLFEADGSIELTHDE